MDMIKRMAKYAGRAALPFLAAVSVYAAVACGGTPSTQSPSTPAAAYTAAQKDSLALDAMKRHLIKYYDAVLQSYQGGKPVDYKRTLPAMIKDVSSILPELALDGKNIDGSIDKLSKYFESRGVIIFPNVTLRQNAEVMEILIADALEKNMAPVNGKEIVFVDCGNIRVNFFPEQAFRLEGGREGFTDGKKVFINIDKLSQNAERQWNRYEMQRERYQEMKRTFIMPEFAMNGNPTEQNIREFRDKLRLLLNDQEYADVYLATMDNKAAFIAVYKGANKKLTEAHEKRHISNAGTVERGSAQDEALARLAELEAAGILPPENMIDGYGLLGDTVGWIYSPFPNPIAANLILSCYETTLLANREKAPALKLEEIDTTQKFALDRVAARFTKLTKDEIASLAEHCDKQLSDKRASHLPEEQLERILKAHPELDTTAYRRTYLAQFL